MRVLHVTHQYRPAIGGAEKYITDLSEELAGRGHQVDVFTSRSHNYRTWRNDLPAFERLDGVDVYRFRSLPRTDMTWRALRYGFEQYWRTKARRYEPFIWYGNGPVCPGIFANILRYAGRYDLVHINQLHYAHSLLAAWAAHLRALPVVITPHLHAEQIVTYDVGYMRTILSKSDAIVADTNGENAFIRAQGWNSNVVTGGVGLRMDSFPSLDAQESRANFDLPANSFVLLFLGRKTEYKGLDICLEAFITLRRQRDDVYFLAVGPETEYSRQLWARYPEVDGLIVRDRVSDDERLAALAACDVLVMPSTGEAFGIVYLEAWAYRKPVIGARIASVKSLISEGEDGFLIEPGATETLVEHLTHLTDEPRLAQKLGNHGRRKLERRYTIERIGDIIEGTYARVLRRHK